MNLVDAILISQDRASSGNSSANPSIIAIVGLLKFHTASRIVFKEWSDIR